MLSSLIVTVCNAGPGSNGLHDLLVVVRRQLWQKRKQQPRARRRSFLWRLTVRAPGAAEATLHVYYLRSFPHLPAASGRASCKDPKCKGKIEKGSLRVSKEFKGRDGESPLIGTGVAPESNEVPLTRFPEHLMKHNYHPACFVLKAMPRYVCIRSVEGPPS